MEKNIFKEFNAKTYLLIVLIMVSTTPVFILGLTEYLLGKDSLLTFVAGILSLLLAVIISLLMASSQHRYLKSLLASIREISKGNFSKKVQTDLTFLPKEFALLIEEFNFMAERIEKLDGFKSNLIDTVSHEFRTPLTSIKGYTSTLLRKDANFDTQTKRKILKTISTQSDRLSRMVDDLLVVPKLEKNILKLDFQDVELLQIIEHATEFFSHDKFEINLDDKITIFADPYRLEQIFLNLFENAHKYSSPPDSPISVRAFYLSEDQVKIIVSNPCEPISKDQLNTLFQKFARLDDTLTRTTGGTGLGLYITKGLIELMNGSVYLNADQNFQVIFIMPVNQKN